MSLHRQSDVKNHLSARYRAKIYLCKPVSGAGGLAAGEPEAMKAVPLGFAEDFLGEHSLPGEVPASTVPVTGCISPQATAAAKNARA